jgi:hypothetical protein
MFMAMGLLVMAAASGRLPAGSGPQMPLAILWLAGTVFFAAGCGMFLFRFLPRLAAASALIALCAFIAIFNWIAFGPGERHFTRTTGTTSGAVSSGKKAPASELEGRLAFGVVAGLLDLMIIAGLYHALRHRGRRDKPDGRRRS